VECRLDIPVYCSILFRRLKTLSSSCLTLITWEKLCYYGEFVKLVARPFFFFLSLFQPTTFQGELPLSISEKHLMRQRDLYKCRSLFDFWGPGGDERGS
jgi:hypothetical protein